MKVYKYKKYIRNTKKRLLFELEDRNTRAKRRTEIKHNNFFGRDIRGYKSWKKEKNKHQWDIVPKKDKHYYELFLFNYQNYNSNYYTLARYLNDSNIQYKLEPLNFIKKYNVKTFHRKRIEKHPLKPMYYFAPHKGVYQYRQQQGYQQTTIVTKTTVKEIENTVLIGYTLKIWSVSPIDTDYIMKIWKSPVRDYFNIL